MLFFSIIGDLDLKIDGTASIRASLSFVELEKSLRQNGEKFCGKIFAFVASDERRMFRDDDADDGDSVFADVSDLRQVCLTTVFLYKGCSGKIKKSWDRIPPGNPWACALTTLLIVDP